MYSFRSWGISGKSVEKRESYLFHSISVYCCEMFQGLIKLGLILWGDIFVIDMSMVLSTKLNQGTDQKIQRANLWQCCLQILEIKSNDVFKATWALHVSLSWIAFALKLLIIYQYVTCSWHIFTNSESIFFSLFLLKLKGAEKCFLFLKLNSFSNIF